MSCNAYKPHLLILPEDEATKNIANGFQQASNVNDRAVQILPFVRGYRDALEQFKENCSRAVVRRVANGAAYNAAATEDAATPFLKPL